MWRLKWGWGRDGDGADRTGALCLGHAEALPRWSVLRLDRIGVMKRSEAGLSELSCSRSRGSGPAHISVLGGVSPQNFGITEKSGCAQNFVIT